MEKRTFGELISRYTLEPTLRDIYVEGQTDKNIVEWILNKLKIDNITVYEIDVLSTEEVRDSRVGGNREDVISLAISIEKQLPKKCDSVRCLADSDFDILLKKLVSNRYLMYTDYSCMEMYTYNYKTLEKLFKMNFGKNYSVKEFDSMASILQEIFVIRLTKKMEEPRLKWVTFTRCCTYNGSSIVFNREEYLERLLGKNRNTDRYKEFITTVNNNRKWLTKEPRNQIHGHDLVELISWYAKNLGAKREAYNEESVKSMIWTAVDDADMLGYPFVKHLEAWA